jgi:hypothetical protein
MASAAIWSMAPETSAGHELFGAIRLSSMSSLKRLHFELAACRIAISTITIRFDRGGTTACRGVSGGQASFGFPEQHYWRLQNMDSDFSKWMDTQITNAWFWIALASASALLQTILWLSGLPRVFPQFLPARWVIFARNIPTR